MKKQGAAKTDTWMPLYIGDYLADTSRLTTEQHGAYLLILMDYWRSGAPPDDDTVLASIAKLSVQQWQSHRFAIERLFQVAGGFWNHKRVEAEKSRASTVSSERSAAGTAGAEKRWQKHSKRIAEPMANASQNDAQSQSQSQEDKEKIRRASRLPADWTLPAEWSEDARLILVEASRTDIQIGTEAQKFKDHWTGKSGKDATKINWQGTWRNWIRNAISFNRPQSNGAQSPDWRKTPGKDADFGQL